MKERLLIKKAKKANKEVTANTIKKMFADIKEVYGILGFFEQDPEIFINEMKNKYVSKLAISPEKKEKKITQRNEAKRSKDYKVADEIREELDKNGIILNDTVDGTIWDLKELY